jgi:hypothetical protein
MWVKYLSNGNDGNFMDPLSMGIAYVRMKFLCMHIINEVHVNIEIQFKHVLPRLKTPMFH